MNMNNFFREVVDTAREVSDRVINSLDELVQVLESHAGKESDPTDAEIHQQETQAWEDIQAHYRNPANGFVKENPDRKPDVNTFDSGVDHLVKALDESEAEITTLTAKNNELLKCNDELKHALQILLDGEPERSVTITQRRKRGLTRPDLEVDFTSAVDSNEVTLTIKQSF